MGVIPHEFRTVNNQVSSLNGSRLSQQPQHSPQQRLPTASQSGDHHSSPQSYQQRVNETASSTSSDQSIQQRNLAAHPVEGWAKERVCQWLLANSMEHYITLFMDNTITGSELLNLDNNGLKDLGITKKEDRERIRKKIKELKSHNDKEKKEMEKEKLKKEKAARKALKS